MLNNGNVSSAVKQLTVAEAKYKVENGRYGSIYELYEKGLIPKNLTEEVYSGHKFEFSLTSNDYVLTVTPTKYGNAYTGTVWVVWATITSSLDFPITAISGTTGNPVGPAKGIEGGYNFTHTIQPSTIITDSNRPDFCGSANPLTCVTNTTAPTGANHPIQGTSLSGGANKK